jgi:hypothetical protein
MAPCTGSSENQVALGDVTVVPVTLARLMLEGLNRYEAVHAIGSVLIGIIFDAMREKSEGAGDIWPRARRADGCQVAGARGLILAPCFFRNPILCTSQKFLAAARMLA